MKTKLVGLSFRQTKAVGIKEGSKLAIVHEESNAFDVLALQVLFNDEHIGYIGKGSDIYDIERDKFPMEAEVVDFYKRTGEDQNYQQFEVGNLVSCALEVKEKLNLTTPSNMIKSFNEDVEIDFNEEAHTYVYRGKFLTGATTYIKKYLEEFDAEGISGRCAIYWNLEKKIIKEAWNNGGTLTAMFGTAIHKALEFEDLNRNYLKKNGDRCFTIKHPLIKEIVDDFFYFYEGLGFSGQVIPEALVSDVDSGICGLADRMLVTNLENKTCRLQDYKVNHSFDVKGKQKFKNLPNGLNLPTTKLSKLALQLKVHAQMLEKSGWTVEGCDGFVFESEWIHYEVDMLKGYTI